VRVLFVVILHLGGYQQFLSQCLTLTVAEPFKRIEIGLVIFHDGLVYQHVLNLCRKCVTLEYQEYQRFEEVLLLTEIEFIFFLSDLERIHGNGLLFRVGYVCTLVISAYTFVGITRIHHDHIRILFQKLTYHTVHVEGLAGTGRADTEEIGIVRHLPFAFFAGNVDTDRQSLTVGVVCGQRCIFRLLQMLLEEKAKCSIRKCQEQVIVRVESIAVTGKTVHEKLQLVVGRS